MANLSMNLGDKLIFDANDATTPNTTYLTNPSAATNPNNTIEVYCNGTKRAEFQNTKLILSGDLEFTSSTPNIRSPRDVTVTVGTDTNAASFVVKDYLGNDIFRAGSWNAVTLQDCRLILSSSSASKRVITVDQGELELKPLNDLILRSNGYTTHPTSKVRLYNNTTELASFGTSGAEITTALSVAGSLSAAGNVVVSGSVYGLVDIFATGVVGGKLRTTAAAVTPPAGSSGDLYVRTDTSPARLYVNVGGTWRYVALT